MALQGAGFRFRPRQPLRPLPASAPRWPRRP